MKLKKTENKISVFFYFYIAAFICLLISFFGSAFLSLNCDYKNVWLYLTGDKKSVSYTLDDMTVTNYSVDGSSITSTTDDGQLSFTVGRCIFDLEINLGKKADSDKLITVYYADENGFSEDKAYNFTLHQNEDTAKIILNQYADALRIDIGCASGETYTLDNIAINNQTLLTQTDFWIKMLCLFLVMMFISLHFIVDLKELYSFLYKWRFVIGAGLVVFGVVFNLNGSSIARWADFVSTPDTHTLFGSARPIRSDEYGVLTSFSISQGYGSNSYSWFSNIIRGDYTDTFIIYGQPVKNILSILFRPFLTGYLIFGASRGLAFFWWGRFVGVWLVTFELSMLITDRKKNLSFLGATLCALSPVLQWWFAINGLAEMMIFGGLAVLMLHHFMTDEVFWHRIIYLLVLYCCAGGYIMTFYPAWMIPMAYAYLALVIWVFITDFKKCHLKWYDIVSIIAVLALFGGSMFYIFSMSGDTVNLVLNTAYPSKRTELGGGYMSGFFKSFGNLLFTSQTEGIPGNVCESAVFFDFFPLGIIGALFVMIRYKKKDWLLILLMILETVLGIYIVFGLPEILAKITLLSMSMSKRAIIGAGYINILLLLRSMSLYRKEPSNKITFLICTAYTLVISIINKIIYGDYLSHLFLIIIVLVSFIAAYTVLKSKSKPTHIVIFTTVLLLCTTANVNPIQRGTADVTKTELATTIQDIVNNDSEGKWIVDSITYPMTNYTIMQGAPTINSTNVYPDLDRWSKFDKDGKYETIYNRYAHIAINMVSSQTDTSENKFELYAPDAFRVYLNADELYGLDVRYVFTDRSLEGLSTDNTSVSLITSKQGYNIYKLAAQ